MREWAQMEFLNGNKHFHLNIIKHYFFFFSLKSTGDWALEQAAQGCCNVSIFGGAQKSDCTWFFWAACSSWLCFEQRVGLDISRDVTSNLWVCILQALKQTSRYGQELIGKRCHVILLPVLISTGSLVLQNKKAIPQQEALQQEHLCSQTLLKTDEGLQACWLQKTTIKHELKEEGQLLDLLDIQEHIVSFSLMLAWLTGIEVLLL